MADRFTDKAKLAEVRREIAMRRRVYARGNMPPHEQQQKIAIMEAIASDYEARLAADPGPLFTGGGRVHISKSEG